jgi:hypothetical protein
MGIGISIVLLAAGAILTWAVTADVSGVEVTTVGVILMVVGGVGLLWALAVSSAMPWRREEVVDERHIHHA